ncbi:hypothetical protein [Sphingobacterium cellulitidis]|uniref:Uncharacterized protein n=1 Tax=Sphingobacterium cellulitidis TaxID=1768011 RepID=A0A8H9G0Y2_9SPHI|nr:hypothetical protein [Sphingobacterium soli]MBA8986147.1 hypothetical protein [Sphingobacterium soli]GGE17972.1 hypothetical protein GCM10011516_14540 [Sphingobacterium soli]
MEFGVAAGINNSRAWILAKRASVPGFGQHYATLHLQPKVDVSTHFRGVAIGYPGETQTNHC